MKEGIGNKILRFNAIFFVSTNLSKTEKGNNQNINFEFYKVYTRKGNAKGLIKGLYNEGCLYYFLGHYTYWIFLLYHSIRE